MGNEITGGNWTVQDNSEDGYGQIRVDSDTFGAVAVCYSGGNGEKEDVSWALANAKLIAAAPELLEELKETERFCNALIERARQIDKMLLEANSQPFEIEIGEITRLKEQLERNRAAITKATT